MMELTSDRNSEERLPVDADAPEREFPITERDAGSEEAVDPSAVERETTTDAERDAGVESAPGSEEIERAR